MTQATLLKRTLDLLLPAQCLACEESCQTLLCPGCLSLLQLLVPEEHCPKCFGPLSPHECAMKGFTRKAFCFEESPISTALFRSSYAKMPKVLAAFLFVQLSRLGVDIDMISSVPLHPLRRLMQQGDPDAILAKEVARLAKIPYQKLLSAISDTHYRAKKEMAGETVLLIGVSASPYSREAIKALKEAGHCVVYGLMGFDQNAAD
jgi:predicted amidophosphoribosyltransferase